MSDLKAQQGTGSVGVMAVPSSAPSLSPVDASSVGQSDSAVETISPTAEGNSVSAQTTGPGAASSSVTTTANPSGSGAAPSPSASDDYFETYIPDYPLPTAVNPSDAAWPFNATVAITLNSTSPMLDFDAEGTIFKVDPDTGYRTYGGGRSGEAYLHFVGVGYGLNGSAEFLPNANPEFTAPAPASNKLYTIRRLGKDLRNTTAGDANLGEMNNLNLSSYQVDLVFGPYSQLSFHNATVLIPFKTQAENFSAMLSQAKTVPVFENGDISLTMDASVCSVERELRQMYTLRDQPSPVFEIPLSGPKYFIEDGHLVLTNSTELVYDLPQNTTLVEVLGPSGSHNAWLGNSQCYAFFNPQPGWWRMPNFPVSTSRKGINATDQTLFLLPIDPGIKYQLRVGGLGRDTTCPLSAIRTYPFHYDFSVDQANTTDSISSTPGQRKSSNTTPIIVGVVVGVVGGLSVLGIALWLFCRRRKRRDRKLLPQPYKHDTVEEHQAKSEYDQVVRREEPQSAAFASSDALPEDQATEPRRQPVRRVVQEEDAEEVFEYLPPQYRETWGRPEPSPSQPVISNDSPGHFSGAGSEQSAGPSTPPVEDLAMAQKARDLNPGRPLLKQEYARAFGRALPRPPQAPESTRPPLKEDYERAFGHVRAGQPQPPQSTRPSLKEEYARAFGPVVSGPSGPPQSTPPSLKEDYARVFGPVVPGPSGPPQSPPASGSNAEDLPK